MNEIEDDHPDYNSGPLSYGQRALWFLQKLAPHSAAYNVMLAARAGPALDAAALRRAFQNLVDRHACLSTSFPAVNGRPIQKVQPHHEVSFEIIDASGMSWDDLKASLVRQSHQPFDLESGPVLRVSLFKHSPQDYLLLLVVHHIVVDFPSFLIIFDELRALYAAGMIGEPASLPPLSVQYLDYARWQVDMLNSPEGERLWTYWQKQLSGDLPPLDLPTDRPYLQVQTYRGAVRSFKLNEGLTRRLKLFVEAEDANLFVLLLASFQVLLSRHSGQHDILVGSPPVGQRKSGFQGVVGFFHNPVVLRADLSGAPTFRSFLSQVRRVVLEALEHQDFPFPLLVERLQPARDLSRSPLFQVMFVLYENGDKTVLSFLAGEAGTRIDLSGLELESLGLEQQAAMLDLTLTVVESDGLLTASVQYNTDLFDEATIIRMMRDYERVLEIMTADPEKRISDFAPSVRPAGVLEVSNQPARKQMDFSLFYFASDDGESAEDRYRLLIEGAKFADRHGFSAIWTPERHFHAFGGLYPNPSVTGAAVATITERIQIKAGSVVLPLHNPIRVAEEWAVVDNLSKGRVGLSFASGWHADDFVFAPETFANRREVMARYIEIVRKLWRGEAVPFTGGAGTEVQVKIMPRPIQRELPVWVTAFGSIETFRLAGEIGANVLTHLLGQSIELVEEKIEIYRKAWRDHGHGPGAGHVTLMLHTFVGQDYDSVREKVRAPFCNYLKSSLDLLIGLVNSAGMDIDPKHLTEQNIDALVTHAFNRYYESCGLFGTPDTCLRMVERLKAAGIDEVACLIDFGVDTDSVLSGLHYLDLLKEAAKEPARPAVSDAISVAGDQRASIGRAATAPRTEMERRIHSVWQEIVGAERIGVDDNFFDLGGDPVLMEKVRTRLQEVLGRDIALMDLFEHLTVSTLAKRLAESQDDHASPRDIQDRAEIRRSLMKRQRQSRLNVDKKAL